MTEKQIREKVYDELMSELIGLSIAYAKPETVGEYMGITKAMKYLKDYWRGHSNDNHGNNSEHASSTNVTRLNSTWHETSDSNNIA